MSDIVKRLRQEVGPSPVNYRAEMMLEAAAVIEDQRKRLARWEPTIPKPSALSQSLQKQS
jgi:hypothetical protein